MLPPAQRLRSSADFSEVVRRGRRSSRPLLTVHVLSGGDVDRALTGNLETAPARAGLVVSKAVGGSVLRHRTARRLRHLLRPRLVGLPGGTRVVVRAAPSAGTAPSSALAADLDAALGQALGRAQGRAQQPRGRR